VVDTFKLQKYMHFNTEAVGAYWQEDTSEWLVKLKRKNPDGTVEEFEDRGHVLLYGTGVLNNPKWPTEIEGFEKFKGRVVHTARWPSDYEEQDWKKDRVAIIGSGASSVQTVPGMQPHVKHMDVFVRTGVYYSGSQLLRITDYS
jgi:hydroxyversicolorone monooxygenase